MNHDNLKDKVFITCIYFIREHYSTGKFVKIKIWFCECFKEKMVGWLYQYMKWVISKANFFSVLDGYLCLI